LADLPYVLAQVEQDFIVPENVQALIWDELVPTLMTSAVLPRWWGVTRNEMHAVTLYQRSGEELLGAAARNEKLRQQVMAIFGDLMAPQRAERIEKALRGGRVEEIMPEMLPAETFYLAAEFRRHDPEEGDSWGAAGKELESLSRQYPQETSLERLSGDFGVPHPALARSYSLELRKGKILPSLAGYGSRLLAESWDSNNLYWARLADELGYSPAALNQMVPHATLRMVEKIFASNLDDWPALLRAMRETGEELRQGRNSISASGRAGAGVASDSSPR
jgi:DNA-binding transcriptional regulator YdaS (Cro superfamily)